MSDESPQGPSEAAGRPAEPPTARMPTQPSPAGSSTPPGGSPSDLSPGGQLSSHRWLVRSMLGLAAVLGVVGIFAVWANRQLLDTSYWTETNTALLENHAIQEQLSSYLTDQIYANVNVAGEIRSGLPSELKPLAGPAAGGLRTVVEKGIVIALQQPRVQQLWKTANEVTAPAVRQPDREQGPSDTYPGRRGRDPRPQADRLRTSDTARRSGVHRRKTSGQRRRNQDHQLQIAGNRAGRRTRAQGPRADPADPRAAPVCRRDRAGTWSAQSHPAERRPRLHRRRTGRAARPHDHRQPGRRHARHHRSHPPRRQRRLVDLHERARGHRRRDRLHRRRRRARRPARRALALGDVHASRSSPPTCAIVPTSPSASSRWRS